MMNHDNINEKLKQEFKTNKLRSYGDMMFRKEELVKGALETGITHQLKKISSTHSRLEAQKKETMLRGMSKIKIIAPKEDALCVDNLVISVDTTLAEQDVYFYIYDSNNKRMIKEKKKLSSEIRHSVKNLKPGLYYWKLAVQDETWVGRVYLCSSIHYALFKDSIDLLK